MTDIQNQDNNSENEVVESPTTEEYVKKANKSFKWVTLAEIFAKIVTPISNMILARFIAPEIFGIVASISVIISFAQIISDGGFSRYIILKDVDSPEKLKRVFGTCFDSTIVASLLIFLPIVIFRDPLATLVNCEGYGLYLALAAIQIPLYGLMSVQTALARRQFDYHRLAMVRMICAVAKVVAQLVLAIMGLGVEALIFGGIVGTAIEDIILFVWYRKWFSLKFSWPDFKEMISTCIGFLFESIAYWLTTALDTLLLGYFFDQTTTGLYKNGFNTVMGIITLVTAIYTNVLISLLMRCKNDLAEFDKILCKYQQLIAYLLVPLSFGIFLYRDFLTYVFFGDGWEGASMVIGAIGLAFGLKSATGGFLMAAFNSYGKPIWPLISSLIDSGWTVLSFLFFANLGLDTFVWLRVLSYLISTIFLLIVAALVLKFNSLVLLKNLLIPLIFTAVMCGVGFGLQQISSAHWVSGLGIVACMLVYFLLFFLFKRNDLKELTKMIMGKQIEIK